MEWYWNGIGTAASATTTIKRTEQKNKCRENRKIQLENWNRIKFVQSNEPYQYVSYKVVPMTSTMIRNVEERMECVCSHVICDKAIVLVN